MNTATVISTSTSDALTISFTHPPSFLRRADGQ